MRIEITWNKVAVVLTAVVAAGTILLVIFHGVLFAATMADTPAKQAATELELQNFEVLCTTNFECVNSQLKDIKRYLIFTQTNNINFNVFNK